MGLSWRVKSSLAVWESIEKQAPVASGKGAKLQRFEFKDLEAATGGFAPANLIATASGSHGEIFLGSLKGGRVVAVKRPADGPPALDDAAAAFDNEMQILSKLFSRRLVNLLGFSGSRGDGESANLLVVEHMENGTLSDRLHGAGAGLIWPMRMQLALQVAKAVRALHASSPPIAHRNIGSASVFIDRDWNARLGNFGLARSCVHNGAAAAEPPRRSNLSSIPELDTDEGGFSSVGLEVADVADVEYSEMGFSHPVVSTKTDVFSFGVLLLEVISGRNAGADFNILDWALPLIKQGHAAAICDPRLPAPPVAAAVKHMAAIAARCVRRPETRRPSMDDIVRALTSVAKLMPLPMAWTAGFPGLTKTSTAAAENSRTHIIAALQEHTLCNATSRQLLRLPAWAGRILRLVKRKRDVVFRLGKFLARKFQIESARYTKITVKEGEAAQDAGRTYHPIKGQPKKPGAKVADERPAVHAEHQLGLHTSWAAKSGGAAPPSFHRKTVAMAHRSAGKQLATKLRMCCRSAAAAAAGGSSSTAAGSEIGPPAGSLSPT